MAEEKELEMPNVVLVSSVRPEPVEGRPGEGVLRQAQHERSAILS
jgi:hypothetical protein